MMARDLSGNAWCLHAVCIADVHHGYVIEMGWRVIYIHIYTFLCD